MNEVWQDNYPWTRFWCPQGGHMAMDGEGYLLDPTRHPERYQLTDVVPFDRIAEKPCLLLLGEPGMGKSSAIKQLAKTTQSPGHEHLAIDLRYQRRSDEDVFGTPEFQGWLNGKSSLHLIIDSLDECAEKDFARRLVGKIKNGPTEKLKLRIACRTAELPPFIRDEFNQIWGQDEFCVYDLAPLRKKDVEFAAGQHANAFLRLIRERGAAPLANRPITLRLLLAQYWKNRALPTSRWDLYASGCRKLCEETSKTRKDAGDVGKLNADARLSIAARIAAIAVMGRETTIVEDSELQLRAGEGVSIRSILGGTEPTPEGNVGVDRNAVVETLTMANLFYKHEESWTFAHQSYAEFLAAYFIRQRAIGSDALKEVLLFEGTVAPPLREIAAWISSIDRQVFRFLTEHEPEILLRSDGPMTTDADRQQILEGILRRIEDQTVARTILWGHCDRLRCNKITVILRQWLQRTDVQTMTKQAAIEIADECRIQEVEDVLLEIVQRVDEDCLVRGDAAETLGKFGNPSAIEKLRPLARGSAGEDPEDHMKTGALKALWPRFMDTEELFECLTPPKQPQMFGEYQQFISHDVIKSLDPDDLPVAIRWLQNREWDEDDLLGLADFGSNIIADELIEHVWRHLREPNVLKELIKFAEYQLGRNRGLFRNHTLDEQETFLADYTNRFYFLQAYFEKNLIHAQECIWLFTHQNLFVAKDLLRVGEWIEKSQQTQIQELWVALVRQVLHDATEDELDAIALLAPYAPQLAADALQLKVSKWQREAAKAAALLQGRLTAQERVETCLRKVEAGEFHAFLELQRALAVDDDGLRRFSASSPNITTSPGWEYANDSTRSRIIAAAKRYLERSEVIDRSWREQYEHEQAGYRALFLLRVAAPNWRVPRRIWQSWVLPIVLDPLGRHSGADLEIHGQLIALVYNAAHDETLWAVNLALDSTQFWGKADRLLAPLWCARLEQLLLLKLQDSSIRPQLHRELLGILLKKQAAGAIAYAHSLLVLPVPSESGLRERSKDAAQMLLVHALNDGWSVLWNVFQNDIGFGREIFLDLANNSVMVRQVPWRLLPEDPAADAFIWIEQQFPHEEDPKRLSGKDYAREQIADSRDRLLQDLYSRGSKASLRAVERIAQTFASKSWTQRILGIAREIDADRNWRPLAPEEVIALGTATRTHAPCSGGSSQENAAFAAEDNRTNENSPTSQKTAYPRINSTDGSAVMTKQELLDKLCQLQDSEIKVLIFRLEVPTSILPGENAPPAERVIAVLKWAENRERLADVARIYRELLGGAALPR